jgi:hypothetical protein
MAQKANANTGTNGHSDGYAKTDSHTHANGNSHANTDGRHTQRP